MYSLFRRIQFFFKNLGRTGFAGDKPQPVILIEQLISELAGY